MVMSGNDCVGPVAASASKSNMNENVRLDFKSLSSIQTPPRDMRAKSEKQKNALCCEGFGIWDGQTSPPKKTWIHR